MLSQAENDIEYRIDKERGKFDLTTSDGKVDFLKAACAVLATLREPIQIDIYAARLADEIGVDKQALLEQTSRIKKQRRRQESEQHFKEIQQAAAGRNDTVNPQRAQHLRCAKAEEGLIALLMLNPDFYPHVSERLKPRDFVTDFNRRVYSAVVELIINKKSIDLTSLSGSFTPEEMGRIAGIQALGATTSNTMRECDDYIDAIFEESDKLALQSPDKMSADEISRTFEHIAAKKNRGSKHEQF